MGYATQHASALAKLKAKGQRIIFTRTTTPVNNDTGLPLAPVVETVRGYALGLSEGDPATYARLGLTFSAAPTVMVVCDRYGDVPPDLALCDWGGVMHTVRDVEPYAPDGVAIYSTVVLAR
ncbi:hypothetical protein [Gemmatimonas sp.]|uniref:hypothetical protein n=1 Tax=Gemmatimonas sp. TaxID=1962908 RepID=UPI00334035FC